ncbi:MAG: PD-(D/E)XK nuclease family protein [Thermodesulfobacteriota bacterium]
MVRDGLLRIEEAERNGWSFADLGDRLRSVPIGNGRERYLSKIDGAMKAVERKKASGRLSDEEGEGSDDEASRLDRRLRELRAIRRLVRDLLASTPETVGRQRDLLEAAQAFLDRHARHTNRFDEYARKKLSDEIRELAECVEKEDVEGLDIWKWMEGECLASPVRGERPQPGRLHVASIHGGGHSGRKHTFIVGLDDSRFPGAGLQDPLLLDGERIRLSRDLPTAAKRLARTAQGFAGLLARLRGNVTLSYCCRSLTDDREMFPSPMVLAAFRILTGNPQGDQDDLIRWLPEPASFAPSSLDRCVDLTESWVWWMCEGDGVLDPQDAIACSFPHLGRGFVAREARASDRFTEYDGYVPQAGRDLDPTKPDGPVLSASALEMAGACPLAYFFRYVLGIRPPDEVRIDPRVWLDPAERGQLLHAVFRRFMNLLRQQNLLPDFLRDEKLLMETLEEEVAWWRDSKPAPSRAAFERETLDLRQASRIFLQEEEEFCKESRPFCFEASMGMMPEGQGTPLDTLEPVCLKLGHGATLRARGRIDRIDQVPASEDKRFSVWDYKTGSSWRYRTGAIEDPFQSGRIVQSALYLQLAETRLRETVSPEATVDRFGYFFPTMREHGERVEWTAAELAEGGRVLGTLCEMLAKGVFLFTDDPGDVSYSDYKDAFGDVHAAADAASRKLKNPKNEPLNPFRRLRGYDRE